MSFVNKRESGRPITIKDEGIPITTNVSSIDLSGSGVSSSAIGDSVTENIPGASSAAWGAITGTITNQSDLMSYFNLKLDKNLSIVGATKTKITFDSNGLVTAGADAVLASSDFANQGTTSTVLHGNASGNPSWGAVSLSNEVSGILPIANGGTNNTSFTNNTPSYFNGTKLDSMAGTYWDNTNKYLSIGPSSIAPTARFHIRGTTASDIIRSDIGMDFTFVQPPNSNQFPLPTVLATTGNINAGGHYYHITYVTAIGETQFNTGISPNGDYTWYALTDATHAQVQLTLPVSTDYRVTHVRIYRSATNQAWYVDQKLVGTVTNGTTTFTDNVSDANRTGVGFLGRINTTNQFMSVDGSRSMYVGTTSTFLGYRAGESILAGTSVGTENTIFGAAAGISTGGSKNVAVGAYVQVGSSGGSVLLGHSAGGGGTNYQGTVIIGQNASFYGSTSYYTTIIGAGAGFGSGGTNAASYDTIIGGAAMFKRAPGSGNNTIIGSQTAYNMTTSVGSIIIGAFVDAPSPTTGGQLNIGNVIYGSGMYGTSAVSSTPVSSGCIGIGLNPVASKSRFQIAAGTSTYSPINLAVGANKTTPVSGDIENDGTNLYYTNSSARQTLVQGAHGQLYEDNETGSTITTTTAGTFYGWTTATSTGLKLMTADTSNATADRLTVSQGGDGNYMVSFSVSYSTTNNNISSHWQVFKNGTAVANINTERKFINGSYVSVVSSNGIISLVSNDYIDLRCTTDNNGEVITIKHCSLNAVRISQ
jgi:hypothetical protein